MKCQCYVGILGLIILTIFIIPVFPTNAGNENISNPQADVLPSTFNVTLEGTLVQFHNFTATTILILDQVFITNQLLITDSIIVFASNNATSLPSLVLINGATLTILNSKIFYLTNVSNQKAFDTPAIDGYFFNKLTIKNCIIHGNPLHTAPFVHLYQADEFTFSENTYYNATNFFTTESTQVINIISSFFYNTTIPFVNIQYTANLMFINNYVSIKSDLLQNLLIISKGQKVLFSKNYFISNSNSNGLKSADSYSFSLSSLKSLQILNNTFISIPRIFYLNDSFLINISGNKYSNFENAFYLNENIFTTMINENFINGSISYIINDLQTYGFFNCTISNFINIQNKIIYDLSFKKQFMNNVSLQYNYYSDYSAIYITSYGYYSVSYTTDYFVDNYPLSQPFENYVISNGNLHLKLNPSYYDSLEGQKLSLFQSIWMAIILFYLTIIFFPFIVILAIEFRKRKHVVRERI